MKPLTRCSTVVAQYPSPVDDSPEPPHTDNGDLSTEEHRAESLRHDSPSSSSSASLSSRRAGRGRVRKRVRPRVLWATRGGKESRQWGDADLGLPLGMSFAAVLAQFLNRTNSQGERQSLEQFTKMCTSAVKESVTNIYGDKYNYFMTNFEKSFGSTIKTLHSISNTSSQPTQPNTSYTQSDSGNSVISPKSKGKEKILNDPLPAVIPSTSNTQLILHNNFQNELSNISNYSNNHNMNNYMLNTLERSVTEQVRSNNLKEFEMGLIMKKLELKQTQIQLNSHSNMMERVKIKLGMAKAVFREEKLKNQMRDARFSDLIKRFIDLLITGLVIMSCCFGYGTYVFSYQRIKEVTESCSAVPKDSNSWWVPKHVSNFNSSWLFFRCHVIALSRLIFSVLIILIISYLITQKSSISGRNMPITFNITLLMVFCGFTGKWCVDSLGADGIRWLVFWEILCGIHFLGNVFPGFVHGILYGHVEVLERRDLRMKYRIRRWVLYGILLVVLPVLAGLLPFAGFDGWVEHFKERFWVLGGIGEEGEL
ncbi:hypothetical protein LUZ60_001313 [Juncus effusus]|nr:hypothetical protein LUZ60_001313 [Juncus effusus]